jgi:gamma-glutamylcyclotransferase (GGCT)/AIG2-like uncharacterized protein YtfP
MTLYFAYGSNMAVSQMRQRCPGFRRLGKASLSGYKWIITTRGYANIVADEYATVEGILYELSCGDEEALDRYEGVATGCYDKVIKTISFGEGTVEAMVYIDPITDEGVPRDEYVERMALALNEANLSPRYVITSVSRFFQGHNSFMDKASGDQGWIGNIGGLRR